MQNYGVFLCRIDFSIKMQKNHVKKVIILSFVGYINENTYFCKSF